MKDIRTKVDKYDCDMNDHSGVICTHWSSFPVCSAAELKVQYIREVCSNAARASKDKEIRIITSYSP